MKLTATLALVGTMTEWTAEKGELPKQLVLRGDGVVVHVDAPPKGSHIAEKWTMTLEEAEGA